MVSDNVVLRPDLRQTLAERAAYEARSIDDLVNEAIEYYLRARQREKLDQEIAAYTRMHPDLWRTMPGQWVAIHDQELVDHDVDQAALYRRVRSRYGRTSVLIRQVRPKAEEEIWVRTPSTGKVSP